MALRQVPRRFLGFKRPSLKSIWEGVLAVGTLALAIATFGLYSETHALVLSDERNGHTQLRAYAIPYGEIVPVTDGLGFSAAVRNTGQTPAIGVRMRIEAALDNKGVLSEVELLSASMPQDIGALSESARATLVPTADLAAVLNKRSASDNGRLTLYGALSYCDVFGILYLTNFKWAVAIDDTGTPQLWPSVDGNESRVVTPGQGNSCAKLAETD